MSAPRVPTVDDLRVKLCYICREEEPNESGTQRTWTHPCKCTLIAHESCLLEWIRSAQGNSTRAENALKCPQCGTQYEMMSHKSKVLVFLSLGDRVLQRAGGVFTLAATAAVMGVMGSGIYITLTAYGAWAVKNFLGKEVFDLMLTDDPSNWPWTAFINLPIIPLSLITSRIFPANKSAFPTIVPILSIWPGAHVAPQRLHHEPWHTQKPPPPPYSSYSPSLFTWPPSPMIFGIFVAPILRIMYKRVLHRFAYWLLGANLSEFKRRSRFGVQLNEGPFMIRIRANIQDENGNEIQEGGNEGGGRRRGGDEVPQDPNAANLAAAERLVDINALSIGRRIGGALLIPYISHIMGSLLFRISKRSLVLRHVLGIKHYRRFVLGLQPTLNAFTYGSGDGGGSGEPSLGNLKYWRWLAKAVTGIWWGGARRWAELDPVWWRNIIGLGLFVVAKDCLYLLHLWHTKREIETRKVRNRDFSGVDIKELDLKPGFLSESPMELGLINPGDVLVKRALR
ncbi:hypothetical protein AGABI1DRAFT_80034 [Agaricus bisporus var. burnettii JB137-S8]|uniref:RING-CH-type domain-containing protein n=1 Tax=Agaricus bisporus var. burnettii (strain JB137-S8 / ATCC MYA-4627 / FGSC 10392) TaxID=597362 RepID=K5WXU3_AGABU|nr:uncharacterized protein AGABI1DRAFT_80034 [Agaricus bisporus var. burnettii JB137-S8]EKM75422.1 hypothetical protein AGABI1DRAFT_80034 [Agaricus bisporus var. burnettii JB137-S8]